MLKTIRKGIKRNFRGSLKDPLLYLRVFSILILGILIFSLTFFFSPISGDFLLVKNSLFAENQVSQIDLFVGQKEKEKTALSYFKLIQENSLASFSVPTFITPKTLGSLGEVSDFPENNSENNKEIIEYIVQSGDTLTSLAEKFGISTDTLIWANNLQKNSKLKVGQKLLILPVSGVLHYVKSGETLSQIATEYKGDIEKIIAFNELSEKAIFAGDILIIPEGIMPAPKKSTSKNFVQQPPQVPLANSYFIFPTQGKISQGLHWYNAVDIASECGTPVYAAAQGQIQKVKFGSSGLGYYIVVSHPNGTTTYYGHLSSILVSQGQGVSQGQIITLMGGKPGTPGAGTSTGCHLHFEVRGARNPFVQ